MKKDNRFYRYQTIFGVTIGQNEIAGRFCLR